MERGRALAHPTPPSSELALGLVKAMRAEVQNIIDEIKRSVTLLRRHL
jgi:hypothetical protein